jgi:FkbM family methyltransferase
VPGGFEVRAPLDDWVGRAVYFRGDLDPEITSVCRALLRRGDLVLDFGANLRLVTMTMLSLVGETGAIHAFEPSPRMFALLAESVARSGAADVFLRSTALGERAGELDLFIPAHNTGARFLEIPRSLVRMRLVPYERPFEARDGNDSLAVRVGPVGNEVARRVCARI